MITHHAQIRKLNASKTDNLKTQAKNLISENLNVSPIRHIEGAHAQPVQLKGTIEDIIAKFNHPINSNDNEHDIRKKVNRFCKMVDSRLCNDNSMCDPYKIARTQNLKTADPDYEIFSIKSRGHSKFFPAKITTSRLVQTSSTKIKQKKESKSKKIEELKKQLKAIVSEKDKGKKEIYIITGSHAPFKLDSQVEDGERGKHELAAADKLENCQKQIHTEMLNENSAKKSEDNDCKIRHNTETQKDKRRDGIIIEEEVNLNQINHEEGSTCVTGISIASQTRRRKGLLISSDCTNISETRKDLPKVVSTKLRFKDHRSRRSDSAISDKNKLPEDNCRKHKRLKHKRSRRKSSESVVRLARPKDVYKKRNIILEDIEKSYLKHKHMLPKEAVEALERNIQKWKNMNVEVYRKCDQKQSNVLDLEEVLKKNNGGHMKQMADKLAGTLPETISTTAFQKKFHKQNDLILLNAVVTGISNINCTKDKMHINKIPKFVRLEKMIEDQEVDTGNELLKKMNFPKSLKERANNRFSMAPTCKQVLCARPNEDVRKEVSFSHLNLKPVVKLNPSLESQLSSLSALLPVSKVPNTPKYRKRPENGNYMNQPKYVSPKTDLINNELISLINKDIGFNVDGVEPPKKHKVQIPSVYVPRKGIFADLKKLEAVTLQILEVPPSVPNSVRVPNPFCDRMCKRSALHTHKKENHRARKSSVSSVSSSESTLHLMCLLEDHVNKSTLSESRNDGNVRNVFMSDQDAIAALKYLPPQHRVALDPVKQQKVKRSKKLQKTIASIVEVKSTQLFSSVRSAEGNRFPNCDLSMVPSKETELLFKSPQEKESLRSIKSIPNRNMIMAACNIRQERSRTSTDSIRSNIRQWKSKEGAIGPASAVRDTGVRNRMLNYSRNVEEMKRSRSRGSAGSSRDSSNDILRRRRALSASGVSTSSGVSLNSECDKQESKIDVYHSGEVEIANESLSSPMEITSTALTKITEETVSQDTLDTSEQSTFSKNIMDSSLKNKNVIKVYSDQEKKVGSISALPILQTNHKPKVPNNKEPKKQKNRIQEFKTHTETASFSAKDVTAKKIKSSTSSSKSLKDDEIRRLTESVKNSIITEIQAMNMANMNNLMQLILNNKCENSKSGSFVKLNQNAISGENKSTKKLKSDALKKTVDASLKKEVRSDVYNSFNKVVVVHNSNSTPDPHHTKTKKNTSFTSLELGSGVLADSKNKLGVSKIPKSISSMGRSGSSEMNNKESKTNRLYVKSITSDTKTSVTSAKWSFKESQSVTSKPSRDNKNLSKFEKRKLYDETLRQKSTKPTIDNIVTNKSYIPVAVVRSSDGNNCAFNLSEGGGSETHRPDGDTKFTELLQDTKSGNANCECCEASQVISIASKPPSDVNFADEVSKTSELPNIYQTFTVFASHPTLTDVFSSKFKKTDSKSLIVSPASELSFKKLKNSVTSISKTESVYYPLKKVESIFRSTKQTNIDAECLKPDWEDPTGLHYDSVHLSLANLAKLSPAQVNLKDAKKCFKNKHAGTLPQNTNVIKPPRKGCHKHKTEPNFRSCNSEHSASKGWKYDFEKTNSHFRLPSMSKKVKKDTEGNYLIFKIDKSLQKRSSSPESFKVFMSNRPTLDTGVAINEYSKDFGCGKPFLANGPPLSRSAESGYSSINDDRWNCSSVSDIQHKPSFSTVSSFSNDRYQYRQNICNYFTNVTPYLSKAENYPEKDVNSYEKSIQTDTKRMSIEKWKRKHKKILRDIQSTCSLGDFILSRSSFHESVAEAVQRGLSEDFIKPLIEESFHSFLRNSTSIIKSEKSFQTNMSNVLSKNKCLHQVHSLLSISDLPKKTRSDTLILTKQVPNPMSSLQCFRSLTRVKCKSQFDLRLGNPLQEVHENGKCEGKSIVLTGLPIKVILNVSDEKGTFLYCEDKVDRIDNLEDINGVEKSMENIDQRKVETSNKQSCHQLKRVPERLSRCSVTTHQCEVESRVLTETQIFEKLLRIYEEREQFAEALFTSKRFPVRLIKCENLGFENHGYKMSPTLKNDKHTFLDSLKSKLFRAFKFREKQSKVDTIFLMSSQTSITKTISENYIKKDRKFDVPLRKYFSEPSSFDNKAIQDVNEENYLSTVIQNASFWTKQMNSVQGIILCLLKYKDTQYFLLLLEAVANNRIKSVIKLQGILKLLKDLQVWDNNISELEKEEDENLMYQGFAKMYKIAAMEAHQQDKRLSNKTITLLQILVVKFKAGEEFHRETISKFIGRGLICNKISLEAAMVYFARTAIFKYLQE